MNKDKKYKVNDAALIAVNYSLSGDPATTPGMLEVVTACDSVGIENLPGKIQSWYYPALHG